MGNRNYIIIVFLIFAWFGSCTRASTEFEKSEWWIWHWQNLSDTCYYFSSGQIKLGEREINTPKFFFSKMDSILSEFYVTELLDYNHKESWKLMKTSMNEFIRINEIDETTIEVMGPVSQLEDLNDHVDVYTRLPTDATDTPFPDSILYDW